MRVVAWHELPVEAAWDAVAETEALVDVTVELEAEDPVSSESESSDPSSEPSSSEPDEVELEPLEVELELLDELEVALPDPPEEREPEGDVWEVYEKKVLGSRFPTAPLKHQPFPSPDLQPSII